MIRVRMLGPIDVASDDGSASVPLLLDHPKRLALFVYLAIRPKDMHQRDALTALFWPDADEKHARNALRQAVHVLRTVTGPDAIVTHRGGGVGVDPERVTSDAAEFETAVASGAHEQALLLYRGDLLVGFYVDRESGFERWADMERERLRRIAFDSAEGLARRFEREGRVDLALKHYRRALELAPHNDSVVRRLIFLLGRSGNPGEALDAYTAFRESARVGAWPPSLSSDSPPASGCGGPRCDRGIGDGSVTAPGRCPNLSRWPQQMGGAPPSIAARPGSLWASSARIALTNAHSLWGRAAAR